MNVNKVTTSCNGRKRKQRAASSENGSPWQETRMGSVSWDFFPPFRTSELWANFLDWLKTWYESKTTVSAPSSIPCIPTSRKELTHKASLINISTTDNILHFNTSPPSADDSRAERSSVRCVADTRHSNGGTKGDVELPSKCPGIGNVGAPFLLSSRFFWFEIVLLDETW